MADGKTPDIVQLRKPTQCVLWEHPQQLPAKFSALLEKMETYEDSSHLTRTLHKCKECGQLYFHEWYEWVDWDEGDDKQYTTLIPIQTPEELAALKDTDMFGLMAYFPRLQWDRGSPEWNGK